jgi:DNA repair photolyase
MKYIPAKTIVTKNKSPESWFGHDYNMNIYRGCSHGCIYCDSRSECYRVDNFDEVRAKENALSIINRELKGKRRTGVVGTGAMSDPYNPFERELELTRNAMKLLDIHGFGAAIATKSDLVTRDIDVLKEINRHSPVCIKITITTFSDELCRRIEPNVTPPSVRFGAIGKLADAGLFCGILLMPILPFINDTEENIACIIRAAAQVGARFVYPWLGVTLRQNQRLYFYQQLDKYFPGLKSKYQAVFGESYECRARDGKRLYRIFESLCTQYGLLFRMPDIISAYKIPKTHKQISFFEGEGE